MSEAIKRLEALKAEYQESAQTMRMPVEYYRKLEAKIDAIEEAILRLKD